MLNKEGSEVLFAPNVYFSDNVDPITLHEELQLIINSPGQIIDQMFLYISSNSAALWRQESNLEGYRSACAIPLKEVVSSLARRIRRMLPSTPRLALVSLGSGEVRQEQWLIQALLQNEIICGCDLYLVDTSYPLLTSGLKGCHQVFRFYPEVCSTGIYANFYRLGLNENFLSIFSKSNQVNLVTMVGYTLGNLANETSLLNNTFAALPSKTFLLVDINLPYGDPSNPEEIVKKDPWLRGLPPWRRLAQDFWAMPFVEHHPAVRHTSDVTFVPILDYRSCRIPGSYAVEIRAIFQTDEFTVQHFKRYSIENFIKEFKKIGYSLISTYPFYQKTRVAVLFQKD